jgi:hypothetical protein
MVDLNELTMKKLKRIKQQMNITGSGANKEQLIRVLLLNTVKKRKKATKRKMKTKSAPPKKKHKLNSAVNNIIDLENMVECDITSSVQLLVIIRWNSQSYVLLYKMRIER